VEIGREREKERKEKRLKEINSSLGLYVYAVAEKTIK